MQADRKELYSAVIKIAALSDTHGYHRQVKNFPEADIFIFAGDCSNTGRRKDLYDFANWLKELPYEHKVVIPGNHDWLFYNKRDFGHELFGADAYYLIDNWVNIKGLKIYGSPWTPEFCGWAFMKKDEDLERHWNLIPETTDVLVTHGPPVRILDRTRDGYDAGSETLATHVIGSKINTHIFGHIHEARGHTKFLNTNYYNVSYQPNEGITLIELHKTCQ